jgi:hypothetical protein
MKRTWVTRLAIACMFWLAANLFDLLITPGKSWPMYYLAALFFDATLVLCLFKFGENSLVNDLQNINYTAIVVHAVGFVMYMDYFPPYSYNAMLYTLIGAQWLRLLWVDPNDRITADYFRCDMVLNSYCFCWQRTSPTKSEASQEG